MTKSRISMIVAAAGLVLVGLLAAALFSPGKDEPVEPQKESDDAVKPVPVQAAISNPLGYKVEVPVEAPKPEVVAPKPVPVKPEPVAKPAAGGVVDYTIKAGDMISKIATAHGCKATDIYKLNPGLDASTASKIKVGQVIKVPVGEKGAEAVAKAGDEPKQSGDYFPRRVVVAEPGDTAFSLAIEHYGSRQMFRMIVDANPLLPWVDRLSGGEEVVLPEFGKAPAGSKPAGETVERSSLIPARK